MLERAPPERRSKTGLGAAAVGSLPAEGLRASLGGALGWGDRPQEPRERPTSTHLPHSLPANEETARWAPLGAARPSFRAAPGWRGQAPRALSRKEGMSVGIIWMLVHSLAPRAAPGPARESQRWCQWRALWAARLKGCPADRGLFLLSLLVLRAVPASLQEAESGARSPLKAWGAKQGREQAAKQGREPTATGVVWLMERIEGPHE